MTQAVAGFYDSDPVAEWQRLDTPYPRIEFLSTLYLIDKYLPKRGSVADIGGGPGRYAIEMLKRGHRVTLTDLSAACIDLAHTKLKEVGLKADQVLCGDARDLSALRSASFDAALLLGPMYHLVEATDRATCLRELHRILKPGGTAVIAYINAWGMYRTGLTDFPAFFENPGVLPLMLNGGGLGIWYYANPHHALDEVKAAGLEVVTYAGAEGPVGGTHTLVEHLAKERPSAYEQLAQFAAQACELPQFRDTTDHLNIVARKPSR